jgi:solute:Na+ symporter, SSS family
MLPLPIWILIGLNAGSLGGLFALGVFTSRAHGSGALLGLGVVLGLRFAEAPVTGLLYGFIGFAVCFGAGWLFSLLLAGAGDRSLSLAGLGAATSDLRPT